MINILRDILSYFPKDESFELKNLLIQESVIRIDGTIGSSVKIDEFKNKLKETKKYDDVNLRTNIRRGNEVSFNMTIKLKISDK